MDAFFNKTHCDRCKCSLNGKPRIMSKINTDCLCMECRKKEDDNPFYDEARKREIEEVKKGNTNYKGLYSAF